MKLKGISNSGMKRLAQAVGGDQADLSALAETPAMQTLIKYWRERFAMEKEEGYPVDMYDSNDIKFNTVDALEEAEHWGIDLQGIQAEFETRGLDPDLNNIARVFSEIDAKSNLF